MNVKEIADTSQKLRQKFNEVCQGLSLPATKLRFEELTAQASAPDFWNDSKHAQKVSQEKEILNTLLTKVAKQSAALDDIDATVELMQEDDADELAAEAIAQLNIVEQAIEELEFRRMLSGELDRNNVILVVNAGAGGTEACDWTGMLIRMYMRWAERKGYSCEMVDFTEGEGAGYKSATLTISGEYAYGYLKAENGVHRLVRISPFDANKRRHTSFSSVYATADIEEDIDIEVNMEEVRVDTFRAGGKGGQHANKTDSAVRFTHEPTGIVVTCRSERSQHQNRDTAMRMLKAKLYELELTKRRQEQSATEKDKKRVEWGSQIRSYVMQPYQMVKDHRTNEEMGNVEKVLDGDLDGFIRKFLLEFS